MVHKVNGIAMALTLFIHSKKYLLNAYDALGTSVGFRESTMIKRQISQKLTV